MFLIADSGSSKTDWRLVNDKNIIGSLQTEGLNPYYKTIDQMKIVLQKDLIENIPDKAGHVSHIYFYGAGCSVQVKCDEVKKALSDCFPSAKMEVNHDILGAARACCGYNNGIVCILGTGSNSCYFDGKIITKTIGGLGFMLGDEGSGGIIGRAIVAAYLNHEMPEDLKTDFYNTYRMDRTEIDKNVYLKPNANRFLATFSLFAEKHKAKPFIKDILEKCFTLFLDTHVCRYTNYTETTVHFVGSVAYYNKDILIELCENRGIKTGKFVLHPVEELVAFHS